MEPISITMNAGKQGLRGADEVGPGKKKKQKRRKKSQPKAPADEPSHNPNYTYMRCRFDPSVRLVSDTHTLSLF